MKKNQLGAVAFLASILISGCGGGGGSNTSSTSGSSNSTSTTPTSTTTSSGTANNSTDTSSGNSGAPSITNASKTFSLPQGQFPWFHDVTIGTNGEEVLVLTTVASQNYDKLTAATAMHMIAANNEGVADVTTDYFSTVPSFFWARNVVAYTDPSTNQPALWFCSQGRETRDAVGNPVQTTPRTNGQWGEQDQLFVMQNGKYVDQTSKLPQTVDFSHGCTTAKLADGNPVTLVKNTLGVFDGNPQQQLLNDNGAKLLQNINFDASILNGEQVWWVGTGDFTKSGKDDIVFSRNIVRKTGAGFSVVQVLSAADLESQGYTNYHSGAIGDLNGDGYSDLVMVLSGDGVKQPFLSGAMLAVFINDGNGHFTYAPNAVPSIASSDMGLNIRIVDINFDGHADIVTSGTKYIYSNNTTDLTTNVILVNNGNSTFSKKILNDPALNAQCSTSCQQGMYILKSKDATSFHVLAFGGNPDGTSKYYGRTITATTPLGLQ